MDSLTQLSPSSKRLEGKVAVITGGASGIGESIVRLFVNHGAKVVIADILDELAEALSHQLGGSETSTFLHCDVACESDLRRAIDTCIRNYGGLNIMVNNAAVVDKESQANILENDTAEFERVVQVNLTGSFLGTKHAARVMGQGGSIINLGSVSSSVGGVASHAYTSSKHGVIGLTKNVAVELGQRGIRVNCVSPYFIRTPLTEKFFKIDESAKGFKVYSNLEGVTLGCEDVASTVLFLAGMSPSTSVATTWPLMAVLPQSILLSERLPGRSDGGNNSSKMSEMVCF